MPRIKELRAERDLSQEDLARLANVTTGTIKRLERTGNATATTLRAVAAALGVPLDDLFEEASA